jgi:RND family efflux transporter MFP subunit
MSFFRSHTWPIIFVGIAAAGASVFYYTNIREDTPDWVTTQVDTGNVRESVSVSGFVEAKNVAELSFPTGGTVTGVLVTTGDRVENGDVLATLGAAELVADRTAAASALAAAEANYDLIAAGPRPEVVSLANSNVAAATLDLERISAEEAERVANARAALLSTGLSATAVDTDESAPPPGVSGTYTCLEEGVYTISVYGSNSQSGFSYRYSGLESGTTDASTDQPTPLGTCGLYLSFTAGETYKDSVWTIEIPNQRSASYTTLLNAYTLAKTQAENAIMKAKDALAIAESNSALSIAPARTEETREALARVREARARVEAIDARLADRSITAPFTGTIIDVSVVTGETVNTSPVITLLSDDAFEVTVRVPEIDIRKILLGQKVSAVFDAAPEEELTGSITYVSPVATQIDGVAYFEATITLDVIPPWLRAGLNADIEIIIDERVDVTRLPRRFVTTDESGRTTVLIQNGTRTATTTIEVLFDGNDGFVEITGLANGTTVVAP